MLPVIQSVHAESTPEATAPHPPRLQTQPLQVAGLEELAKITDTSNIQAEGTLETI